MTYREQAELLETLRNGVNPETGEVLSDDSLIFNEGVALGLTTAVHLLR